MLDSLLIAIAAIVALMLLWAIVQTLWRRVFSDYVQDDDVLAERRSCGNCGCATACENKRRKTAPSETILQP